MKKLEETIFSIKTPAGFESCCMDVFRFQSAHCAVYKEYMSLLGVSPDAIRTSSEIPFLPISFFKTRAVVSTDAPPQAIFTSSGTGGSQPSQHVVADLSLYEKSFTKGFDYFYGAPGGYTILALLPSYLERQGSSLVYMAEKLMEQSARPDNGFYLHNFSDLRSALERLQNQRKKVLLIGVSYALLDFAEEFPMPFPELIVMETGGMKGKREELPRSELHRILKKGFGVERIHSEYGMTELLSQAYSKGNGIFHAPPWLQIRIRDQRDPLSAAPDEATGGINVIDLANIYSCSFIETQDLGVRHAGGSFEVVGRFAQSDVRGCNLMYER